MAKKAPHEVSSAKTPGAWPWPWSTNCATKNESYPRFPRARLKWSDEEDRILATHFPNVDRVDELLPMLPGRSLGAIKDRALTLKISRVGISLRKLESILGTGPATARQLAAESGLSVVCVRHYMRALIRDGKAHVCRRVRKRARGCSLPEYTYALGLGVGEQPEVEIGSPDRKEPPRRDPLTAAFFGEPVF